MSDNSTIMIDEYDTDNNNNDFCIKIAFQMDICISLDTAPFANSHEPQCNLNTFALDCSPVITNVLFL